MAQVEDGVGGLDLGPLGLGAQAARTAGHPVDGVPDGPHQVRARRDVADPPADRVQQPGGGVGDGGEPAHGVGGVVGPDRARLVEAGEHGGEQLAGIRAVGGPPDAAAVAGGARRGAGPRVGPVVRIRGVGEEHGRIRRETGAVTAAGHHGMGGPGGLRAVLGRVGESEEPVGGGDGADRVTGGRHAAGHPLALGEGQRPGAEFLRHGDHLVRLLTLRQQAELVSAEPGGETAGQFGGAQ